VVKLSNILTAKPRWSSSCVEAGSLDGDPSIIVGWLRAKSVKIVFDQIALEVDLAHAEALKTVHPAPAWMRCQVAGREAQRRPLRAAAGGQQSISVRTEIDDATIFGKDNPAAHRPDEGGNFGDPDAVRANSQSNFRRRAEFHPS
jgi:hypothetical protein